METETQWIKCGDRMPENEKVVSDDMNDSKSALGFRRKESL